MTYPLKNIFNPLSTDFTTTYDIHGTGEPVSYTIHAGELEGFPAPVADHIAKHLAHEYVNVHGRKPNYDVAYQKALKIINVEEDEL